MSTSFADRDVRVRDVCRDPTPTEETIHWLANKNPDELITFTVLLPERPFSWQDLRYTSGAARDVVIQRRQADLQPVQAPIVARLKGIGAEVLGTRWLANAIDVRFPVKLAVTVASWPDILYLEHGGTFIELGAVGEGYWGGDRRNTVHAERLLSAGFKGQKGAASSPTSPVRLGSFMANSFSGVSDSIPKNHPGFQSGGATRYYAYDICDPLVTPPLCVAGVNPFSRTHDTAVMTVMAGSIEAGQDPIGFPGSNTQAQVDRSGIAPLAQLEYVQAGDNTVKAIAIAMQRALANGVDVLNFSGGFGTNSPSDDVEGMNAQITNAFNAGVLMTFAGGNNNTAMMAPNFSSTCNQLYPSTRSEGIAVNGINTNYVTGGALQPNAGMANSAWSTSGCTINVFNSSGSFMPSVNNSLGPLAPGSINKSYFWNSSTNWGYESGPGSNWGGSSLAAPQVAGAAGLLRDAFFELGFGVRPNYWLKTDLLMLTDGYKFIAYPPTDNQTSRLKAGTSQFSGTGRLQLRYPSGGSFPDAPTGWQWSWGSYTLANGGSFSKTVPANIQNYRMATFWQEPDLTHVGDIDVFVDALNAAGSVCQPSFAFQNDFSIINAIHLKRSDIPACALPGGSLRITFVAFAIPPGETRLGRLSDLWDNEITGNGY